MPPLPPYNHHWRDFFTVLRPWGVNCRWNAYERDKDYRLFFGTGIFAGECGNMCLRDAACTGFEKPGDESYCLLWYGGACGSDSAKGLGPGPSSGPTSFLEFVRIKQVEDDTVELPTWWPVPVAACVLVLLGCFLRYHKVHQRKKAGLLSETEDARLWMVEMTSEFGEVTYVRLEDRIRQALSNLQERRRAESVQRRFGGDRASSAKGSDSGKADTKVEKFAADLKALRMGHPQEAARGINAFMRVPDSLIYTGMTGGVHAIVVEWEQVWAIAPRAADLAACRCTLCLGRTLASL